MKISTILITLSIVVFIQKPAYPADVMTYIYNAPESTQDRRYDFQWEILRTALERTKEKYGEFHLKPSRRYNERRQTRELIVGTGELTVMHLGTTQKLERELIPVRIPVDKNLSGYMIYLIRKEDQPKFSAVTSLNDLRKFLIGLGHGWIDVKILKHSDFKVVTGSDYEGLFRMLIRDRFDAFQRSAAEIIDEYDQRKAKMPNLHIEQDLLFYYPLPMYFWFTKSPKGKHLATRAKEGMMAMIEDGSYDALFYRYNKFKIDRLRLKERKLFKIENPLLVPETPFEDKRLWFDPLK